MPVVRAIKDPVGRADRRRRSSSGCRHVVDIGLDYLSLNRETDTLSGGESQRVKMVKHLGSSLVDVHVHLRRAERRPAPARRAPPERAAAASCATRATPCIVVEHDPDVIKVADHVVDVGPQARARAGGDDRLRGHATRTCSTADTLTGRHLQQRAADQGATCARRRGQLPIRNARANNLQNVSVDIPTGVLTVVTGVAGSGKSSLINEVFLRQHPDAIVIDQSAVGRVDALQPGDLHRRDGRRAQGVRGGQQGRRRAVQLQLEGRVRELQGLGRDLHRPGVPRRRARRRARSARAGASRTRCWRTQLDGKSISDVLALTVAEALDVLHAAARSSASCRR